MTPALQLTTVAETLLRDAGVLGTFPTPIDEVIAAAGLAGTDHYVLTPEAVDDAPPELRSLLASAASKIVGLLDRRERIVHIDPTVTMQERRSFIALHEVAHHVIPWQNALVYADNDESLSPMVRAAFEREANVCAAELLFQLDAFEQDAGSVRISLDAVRMLAGVYGSSFRAAFRRYGERNPRPVLAATFGAWPTGQELEIDRFEVTASRAWRASLPVPSWPARLHTQTNPVGAALRDEGEHHLIVNDHSGRATTVRLTVSRTPWNTFALFTPI